MKKPAHKKDGCRLWRRVLTLGGKRVLRCARYSLLPRRAGGYRRGHRPDNEGASCKRFALVYSPWFNKKVYRCKTYGRGGVKRSRSISHAVWSPAAPRERKALPKPVRVQSRVVQKPTRVLVTPVTRIDRAAVAEGYIPLSLPSMERARFGRG